MTLELLPDSFMLLITEYIDEEDTKTLSLANKAMHAKIRNNIKIANRLLVYEFKIARSIINEIKKDPYVAANGFLGTKELRNGVLINKEPDPLTEVQKIYTSTAYRLHNEMYMQKQMKLYAEQRRRTEKRLERMRKEDELYFPRRVITPAFEHEMQIDLEKFRAEIEQSSQFVNYVYKIDNYLQDTLSDNIAIGIAAAKATGKQMCPYFWYKRAFGKK